MRILITNHTLAARAGTEMYVRDLAFALADSGINVACYSPKLGEVANELRSYGIETVDDLQQLTHKPDLIHAHHFSATATVFFTFPDTPSVFVCHGLLPWPETPLIKFGQIRKFVAVDRVCKQRLIEDLGLQEIDITIIHNGVDLQRFQAPLHDDPTRRKRALIFSNQAQDTSVQSLRAACEQNNISLDIRGSGAGDPVAAPEEILANYGLVFAKGRAAMEAMACGCQVILADYGKWGGAVTPQNWHELRALNFGLRAIDRKLNETAIGQTIAALDWTSGAKLCKLIQQEASLQQMVTALIEVYEQILSQRSVLKDSNYAEAAQFMQALTPLLYERDELATRLYEETKLRLGNEATNADLLVQAMVTIKDGPDQILVRRLAEQVLCLQPGHPIALEILGS